jgi:proline iminopeptidase
MFFRWSRCCACRSTLFLINAWIDLQAPLKNAWDLRRAWPAAELVVVEDAGHADVTGSIGATVSATDRFARTR